MTDHTPSYLPHELLHPHDVAWMTRMAVTACGGIYAFTREVDLSASTINRVMSERDTSTFVRNKCMQAAQHIINDNMRRFSALLAVDATLPERPSNQEPRLIPIPPHFHLNHPNPFDRSIFPFKNALYQLLYMSVRPDNHQHIFGYKANIKECRASLFHAAMEFGPDNDVISTGNWLRFFDGEIGHVNRNAQWLDPTLLDRFSRLVDIEYNVWGQALRLDLPDIEGDR